MKETSLNKWQWLIIGLAIFSVVQFYNHTGYCYSERRHLSEIELIDRFLFKEKASSMSLSEKKEFAKLIHLDTLNGGPLEYPECCTVRSGNFLISDVDHFLNRTILGKYLYEMTIYSPVANLRKGIEPYRESIIHINACGNKKGVGTDDTAIGQSKKAYKGALERNKRHWGS